MKKIFGTILFVIFANTIFAQATCNTALPFCTGTNYTFPASTNTPAPTGANFGCLWTQPNPAFYFLEIDNPGNITINIQGLGVPNGTEDIDFICGYRAGSASSGYNNSAGAIRSSSLSNSVVSGGSQA